jgi:hypothetical protein
MQFRTTELLCCSERWRFPPPVSHKPPPLHWQLRERWSPQPNCHTGIFIFGHQLAEWLRTDIWRALPLDVAIRGIRKFGSVGLAWSSARL